MGPRTPKATRIHIALCCTECSSRNYKTTRSKKADQKPIVLKKFCPACNSHTVHLEAK